MQIKKKNVNAITIMFFVSDSKLRSMKRLAGDYENQKQEKKEH